MKTNGHSHHAIKTSSDLTEAMSIAVPAVSHFAFAFGCGPRKILSRFSPLSGGEMDLMVTVNRPSSRRARRAA